jgi:hypothetical protein
MLCQSHTLDKVERAEKATMRVRAAMNALWDMFAVGSIEKDRLVQPERGKLIYSTEKHSN